MTTRGREPGPFARRLASLRQRAYLSQGELAKLSGLSEGLIQSLEEGRAANPTLRTLLLLARALRASAAELLEGVSVAGDGPD
jgi:transcriptional regulator with XRE-family HTH domain